MSVRCLVTVNRAYGLMPHIGPSRSVVRLLLSCFFFQAEDGIRDYKVTGVQTCALPIYMANNFKTAVLLTGMTLFLLFVGQALGGQRGMAFALAFAAFGNFISYFFSDKIALAMYGAQPVTREQLPRVYNVVEGMTQRIGLPMPKIYVIPNESPNAFATGRNPAHASVAVTQGILNLLDDEELEGVLAHELGHVRNRDILISSVA